MSTSNTMEKTQQAPKQMSRNLLSLKFMRNVARPAAADPPSKSTQRHAGNQSAQKGVGKVTDSQQQAAPQTLLKPVLAPTTTITSSSTTDAASQAKQEGESLNHRAIAEGGDGIELEGENKEDEQRWVIPGVRRHMQQGREADEGIEKSYMPWLAKGGIGFGKDSRIGSGRRDTVTERDNGRSRPETEGLGRSAFNRPVQQVSMQLEEGASEQPSKRSGRDNKERKKRKSRDSTIEGEASVNAGEEENSDGSKDQVVLQVRRKLVKGRPVPVDSSLAHTSLATSQARQTKAESGKKVSAAEKQEAGWERKKRLREEELTAAKFSDEEEEEELLKQALAIVDSEEEDQERSLCGSVLPRGSAGKGQSSIEGQQDSDDESVPSGSDVERMLYASDGGDHDISHQSKKKQKKAQKSHQKGPPGLSLAASPSRSHEGSLSVKSKSRSKMKESSTERSSKKSKKNYRSSHHTGKDRI